MNELNTKQIPYENLIDIYIANSKDRDSSQHLIYKYILIWYNLFFKNKIRYKWSKHIKTFKVLHLTK